MLDQERLSAEEGRIHIDFQIVRAGEFGWAVQALSDRARKMVAQEFNRNSQEPEEVRIVTSYVETMAVSRYLSLRGFSVRSRPSEMQDRQL